ncbi:hypothetical protein PS1_038663 [Malus domestica]
MALPLGFCAMTIFLLVCGFANAQARSHIYEQAWHEFSNCFGFSTGVESDVSIECCTSVTTLNRMAKKFKNAPSVICHCIEDMAWAYQTPYVASRIPDIPIQCNEHLSFPISNNMDCNKYYTFC